MLKKYVDVFSNDKEAWEELAEMYLEVCGTHMCIAWPDHVVFVRDLKASAYLRGEGSTTLGGLGMKFVITPSPESNQKIKRLNQGGPLLITVLTEYSM